VKGSAYQNFSGTVNIFDAQDAVVPPLMKDAFFITTRFQAQEQTRNMICSVASDNTTNSGRKCSKGCIEGDTTLYGIMTGNCGKYGYCEILTWCPLEKDPKIDYQNLLYGIRNFSVFIRTNVQFPLFDITVTSGKSPVPGLSLFYLRDMLKDTCNGECFENARMRGAVILAKAEYECDLDKGKSGCRPQWSFSRIDEGDGFNFRSIRYLDRNSTTREIRKLYGINVVVDIYGRAGRFDVVSLLTAIGAGLGLLTLATIIADFLLNTIWPRRELFLHDKFLTVNLEHETDVRDFSDTQKSGSHFMTVLEILKDNVQQFKWTPKLNSNRDIEFYTMEKANLVRMQLQRFQIHSFWLVLKMKSLWISN